MSDLTGGGPIAAPSGNGRAQKGGSQNALGPVSVPGESRTGIRTPTDIMRQRRDREAKRKAEESRQRPPQPRPIQSSVRATSATQRPTKASQPSSVGAVNSQSQIRVNPFGDASAFQGGPMSRTRVQSLPKQSRSAQSQNPNASSFSHPLKRWKTLSSHWESLTSYWIKRLEENSHGLKHDPIHQHLFCQLESLSATGTNLYHAIVDLQQQRESSEREFQLWFIHGKVEQERAQQKYAEIEKALDRERDAHAKAIAELSKVEPEKNTFSHTKSIEQMVEDMRRELDLTKQEAQRAWLELGKIEQEQRDRMTYLQAEGHTIVGGVQVVPMMQKSTNQPFMKEERDSVGTSTG